MAKNHVKLGNVLTFVNSGSGAVDIVSGAVVVVGSVIGVALVDIPVGKSGSVKIDEVWRLPKDDSVALEQGQAVFWDTANKQIVAAAGATIVPAGIAFDAVDATAKTANVVINLFTPDHA